MITKYLRYCPSCGYKKVIKRRPNKLHTRCPKCGRSTNWVNK